MDQTRKQARLEFAGTPATLIGIEGGAEAGLSKTLDLAAVALAAEQVGGAQHVLDASVEYAKTRIQFGRPIGSFQAVRHRLADSLIALEAADGLLSASWSQPTPSAAALAKGLAGRQSRLAARHAQQVLAGIGFTAEHPLHHFVRRVLVLDQLIGAGSDLTRQSGAAVLASRSLPPALPL
jgi:alkylation response protein AidB-like acyl-CoA dehydrogenase